MKSSLTLTNRRYNKRTDSDLDKDLTCRVWSVQSELEGRISQTQIKLNPKIDSSDHLSHSFYAFGMK